MDAGTGGAGSEPEAYRSPCEDGNREHSLTITK
jgi:hypothetical protein